MIFKMGNDTGTAAICILTDNSSNVRRYLLHFISGLSVVANRIVVVAKENIDKESRDNLVELGVEIIHQNNTDSEQMKYRGGINHLGYENISGLNNLILTNDAYYGPIFPLSKMFMEMEGKNVDFWHIISHHHPSRDASRLSSGNEAPICMQGYWIVFRNTILCNPMFREYWTSKRNKDGAIRSTSSRGELSRFFEKCGFVRGTYIGENKYRNLIGNNDPRLLSDRLVIEDECPLVDRELFSCNGLKKALMASVSHDDKTRKAFAYLEENTEYDIDLIWDDMLSTSHMSSINENLHLDFILPTGHIIANPDNALCHEKVALIQYIYPEDLVTYCRDKAASMPEGSNIFVVTANKKTEKKAREEFAILENHMVHFRTQENRGRDNTALLVTCRDVVEQYDYICFVHGKKSVHCNFLLNSIDFREYCFENLLYNRIYVQNIISTFDCNPRLGILSPFTPHMGFLNSLDPFPWSNNYELARDFLKKEFGIERELDPNLCTPFGGMFWFRGKALRTLLSRGWKMTDFPEEPLQGTDGLLTHVIERVYPMLAQCDGYYTARGVPLELASTYLNIIHSRYRELMREMSMRCGYSDFSHILRWLYSKKSNSDYSFLHIDAYERRFIDFYREIKRKFPRIKNFIKKYFLANN